MKRPALVAVPISLAPPAAMAHPGHVVEAAGHDHWLAGAAIAAAAAIALWAALRGRKPDAGAEDEADSFGDEEEQEA